MTKHIDKFSPQHEIVVCAWHGKQIYHLPRFEGDATCQGCFEDITYKSIPSSLYEARLREIAKQIGLALSVDQAGYRLIISVLRSELSGLLESERDSLIKEMCVVCRMNQALKD